MKRIICFDFNGTLTDQDFIDILSLGKGKAKEKIKELFSKKISSADFWNQLTLILRKTGNANIEYMYHQAEDIFNNLKEGAEDLMIYLKEKGYKIYLISCSADVYLERLAQKLQLDGFYAGVKFIFDENGELISIESECSENNLFKVEKVKEIAEINNVEVEDIVFVGDGTNDIGAFKITKNGIAINSDVQELREIAWKNIKELREIKDIL